MDSNQFRTKLPNIPRAAAIGAGIFVLIAGGVAVATVTRANAFTNTILPGLLILDVPVGGLTRDAAHTAIQGRADDILSTGFTFTAGGNTTTVSATTLSPNDPDLSKELARYSVSEMVDRAFAYGHSDNEFIRYMEIALTLVPHTITVRPIYEIDNQTLIRIVREEFAELEVPVKNATLEAAIGAGEIRYTATDPKAGRTLRVPAAVDALGSQLEDGTLTPVAIAIVQVEPTISRAEAAGQIPAAERFITTVATTTIIYDDAEWNIPREDLAAWIAVERDSDSPRLAFDEQETDTFFDTIADEVEVEPRDAKFRIQNGKVIEFQGSREGVAIDREATRTALERAWLEGGGGATELVTEKTKPNVATGDVNDLGIKEVLGVGRSNFSGSPRNRISNIRNGITRLNGTLIKPDEEFSLLGALRPFTVEGGYLPELVIKGDKIIPEIGGGLCQIGTTTFRMAMNSGMNITQRQNHSLVVRYYNDPKNGNPGTDATIYDPSPDFKFKNDTGAHLLITTEMNTTTGDLSFTLWGTSDGRKGSYSKPVVLNWASAGDPKEVPTTDIPPGERKCDVPHPGANTSFTYTMELADGTKKDTVYTSRYRALPQTCLVGVTADQLPPLPAATTPVAVDAGAAADAGAPAQ